MVLSFVIETSLSKVIQKLSNKFSQDHYCVNNFILKKLEFSLVPVFTVFFNDCTRKRVIQECLKTAIVNHLHKLGNFVDTNNFRPISILPTITKAKYFKKFCSARISRFLDKNNGFSQKQYSFRRKISTIKTLVIITSEIQK